MKINLKKLPKSITELEKIILFQQQEIEKQKQEILSHKERYVRLIEEFKLEKAHRFCLSSEKIFYRPIYLMNQVLNLLAN